MLIMNKSVEHPKWIEWCKKSEDEQYKIAEENGWFWYPEWFDCGYLIRCKYEEADPDPKVAMKYKGYDNYYKEHETGASYVYLGPDARFHETKEPTHTWIEYQPCTNTKCVYHDPSGWGGSGGNCGYLGARERLPDCFDELFARIQSFVDVCGIENIDKFQEEFDIHPDIIGWFKFGDDYFKNKKGDKMNEEIKEKIIEKLDPYFETKITNPDGIIKFCQDKGYIKTKNEVKEDFVDYIVDGKAAIEYDAFDTDYCVNNNNDYSHITDDVYLKVEEGAMEHLIRQCNKLGYTRSIEKERLVEEIANEEGKAIEDPWIDYDVKNPDDGKKYYAMVGFHSITLINDEDEEYQGDFGVNGKYINDASKLIRDIENSAEDIRLKYADKGIKVTIGDFNVGCQYGMSIYVWVPYHNE